MRRLSPPGFFKYEDIAKETPVNPQIQDRINGRKNSKDAAFPVLASTPSQKLKPPSAANLEAGAEQLQKKGDEVRAAVAIDQERARAENAASAADIEKKRAELADEIEALKAQAAQDRKSRPAIPDANAAQ